MRGLVALATLAACQPRTELLVGVATDLTAPGQLDHVHLDVSVENVVIDTRDWDISGPADSAFNLPGSYGLSSDGDATVSVRIIGSEAGSDLVTREAVVSIVDGQTLFYRMGLTASCMTAAACSTGQTCIEGACQPMMLDSSRFPTFDSTLVTQLTCKTASTPNYIDTKTGQPMQVSSGAAICPSGSCSEGTCLTTTASGVAHVFKGIVDDNQVFDMSFATDGSVSVTIYYRDDTGAMQQQHCTGTADATTFSATCGQAGQTISSGTYGGGKAMAIFGSGTDGLAIYALEGADVKRYCGTFAGDVSGGWSFVTESGQLLGNFDAGLAFGQLAGTAEGSAVSMTWDDGGGDAGTASGTISSDASTVTGTWSGMEGTAPVMGTFTNDMASCADQ